MKKRDAVWFIRLKDTWGVLQRRLEMILSPITAATVGVGSWVDLPEAIVVRILSPSPVRTMKAERVNRRTRVLTPAEQDEILAANALAPEPSEFGRDGHPRNPVSWFFYSGGSTASRWGLTAGSFAKVTAMFLAPHRWQAPERFTHQGDHAFFAFEGCRDTASPDLCLFPEIRKNELHGIRKVVEAHSKKGSLQGAEAGTANGLAFQRSG